MTNPKSYVFLSPSRSVCVATNSHCFKHIKCFIRNELIYGIAVGYCRREVKSTFKNVTLGVIERQYGKHLMDGSLFYIKDLLIQILSMTGTINEHYNDNILI